MALSERQAHHGCHVSKMKLDENRRETQASSSKTLFSLLLLHCSGPEMCVRALEQALELSCPPSFQNCSCPHQKPEWDRQVGVCVYDQLSWTGHLSDTGTGPLVRKPFKGLLLHKLQGSSQILPVTSTKPDLGFQSWVIRSLTFHCGSHSWDQVPPVPILCWWQQFILDDNSLPLRAEWQGQQLTDSLPNQLQERPRKLMPYKKGHEGREAKRVFQWAPLSADVPGVAQGGVMDQFQ